MKLGGIIAGALGGGAQALGQMADANLRAQAENERISRERDARMQEAQTQRQWRKEDAIAEMDQRLARIGTEVKAKTQASIEAQGMLNTEREKIRGGLVGAEIDKAIPPHIAEQSKNWSPEAQAQLAADKEAVRSRAMSDPNVGREVGLVMGEINQKDIMTNDVAQERAKNQALRDQMRADQESTKEEGRNSRADARIEALVGRDKNKAETQDKLSTVIREQRQVVEAYQKRKEDISYRSWARNNPDQAKQLDTDIEAARDIIRAATAAQKSRMGADFGEQQPTGKTESNAVSTAQATTDRPEVLAERVRIIRDEYDAAVKRGDKEVADSNTRELKRLGADVNQVPKSGVAKPSASAGQIVSVNTKDQYDQLPSGARFKAPDGTTRIKP
jgi:hypothetical protein